MLTDEMVCQVRRMLLARKLSQRQIAQRLNVSRASVARIALHRSNLGATPRPAMSPGVSLVRCPGCGGLVVLPCRLCQLRTTLDEQQVVRRQEREQAQHSAERQLLLESLRRERQRDAAERVSPRKAG